jgi:hypothetical protein
MNSGCAMYIGKTHRICQDYAMTGTHPNGEFAILADGCSSSEDSDIGARLLVRSASRELELRRVIDPRLLGTGPFYLACLQRSSSCSQSLGLSPVALDATLLMVHATKRRFIATCYGDGIVALGRADGSIEAHSIQFENGFPNFPSYLLDPVRRQHYETHDKGTQHITTWTLADGAVQKTNTVKTDQPISLWQGDCADYHFVALISDGAHTFEQMTEVGALKTPTPVPVPAEEILVELLAFKSFRGEFVRRRLQTFLRQCEVNARYHNDDFSVGAVFFEE